ARAKSAPIGVLVDERCIVNAVVTLLATGGSTNHLMHWVAVARAAGMVLTWDDFEALSQVSPLLCRIYPNGQADVNDFAAAGGTAFVLRELLDAGLLHGDVLSVAGDYRRYTEQPVLGDPLHWQPAPAQSGDASVLRPAAQPFSPSGGVRLLQGNLGRAVIKVSAVPDDRHVVEAPARVFDSQAELLAALQAREITQDTVVVVRFQGPQANGMPELHKLTPGLAVLQSQGLRVALVTDGRMSGASGKVPAAIHVCPEAMNGGPLAKVRDGDLLRVDAVTGRLDALVPEHEWAARAPAAISAAALADNAHGLGRELFAGMRRLAARADEGAVTWL
ncbi:MAG: dihydroxy-acid dehydratase, partial [Betaproteobacteria bacterium]|nr:dihydroxy-acid dehydratase [Betaproteobacteria bacterium]